MTYFQDFGLACISHRTALHIKVGAPFVLEWNQDNETFDTRLEAAAPDIHVYIIHYNDLQYEESRICAPFKECWHPDLLRVTDGIPDYSVIGKFSLRILQLFQSSHRFLAKLFETVPDQFEINFCRKVFSAGEKE